MLWLEWSLRRHADIVGLLIREFSQLNPKLFEVQAGDLFIKVLRQCVDLIAILALILMQSDLGQRLVGE